MWHWHARLGLIVPRASRALSSADETLLPLLNRLGPRPARSLSTCGGSRDERRAAESSWQLWIAWLGSSLPLVVGALMLAGEIDAPV